MTIGGVINFEILHTWKQNEVVEMSPEWGLKYLWSFLFKELRLSSKSVSCIYLTEQDRNVVVMQQPPLTTERTRWCLLSQGLYDIQNGDFSNSSWTDYMKPVSPQRCLLGKTKMSHLIRWGLKHAEEKRTKRILGKHNWRMIYIVIFCR